jgi:hypothetical protein
MFKKSEDHQNHHHRLNYNKHYNITTFIGTLNSKRPLAIPFKEEINARQ